MNFEMLKNQWVAILFKGSFLNLPDELAGWQISDFDSFQSNLDLWNESSCDLIEALFSKPKDGIKQHLANTQDQHVGLAGVELQDKELLKKIISKYQAFGYNILEIDSDNVKYIQSTNSNKVKIRLT